MHNSVLNSKSVNYSSCKLQHVLYNKPKKSQIDSKCQVDSRLGLDNTFWYSPLFFFGIMIKLKANYISNHITILLVGSISNCPMDLTPAYCHGYKISPHRPLW